jgi:hypothetical protein
MVLWRSQVLIANTYTNESTSEQKSAGTSNVCTPTDLRSMIGVLVPRRAAGRLGLVPTSE